MRAFCVGLAAAAFLATSSIHAHAAPLETWYYEGILVHVSGELRSGDPFFGWFTFDRATPDEVPDSMKGQYRLLVSVLHLPTIGSQWTFTGPGVTALMAVLNDIPPQGTSPGFDFFEVYQRNTPFNQELPDPTRRMYFNGSAPSNLFDSDAIPDAPPPVSAFGFLGFYYTDFATPVYASGQVTHLYAVPEPAMLALLGLGLAGLAFARRKQ